MGEFLYGSANHARRLSRITAVQSFNRGALTATRNQREKNIRKWRPRLGAEDKEMGLKEQQSIFSAVSRE